jgi:hypothetical protein
MDGDLVVALDGLDGEEEGVAQGSAIKGMACLAMANNE